MFEYGRCDLRNVAAKIQGGTWAQNENEVRDMTNDLRQMSASFLCRLYLVSRVLHKKQRRILCCWRRNFVSSSEQNFVACDTTDSNVMEVSWTTPLRTSRHSRFCTDSSHSYIATHSTCQRHYKLMLQGSPREQGPRSRQETHDLNKRRPRELGREKIILTLDIIPDIFRCKRLYSDGSCSQESGHDSWWIARKVWCSILWGGLQCSGKDTFPLERLLCNQSNDDGMWFDLDVRDVHCYRVWHRPSKSSSSSHRAGKNGGSRGEWSCLFQAWRASSQFALQPMLNWLQNRLRVTWTRETFRPAMKEVTFPWVTCLGLGRVRQRVRWRTQHMFQKRWTHRFFWQSHCGRLPEKNGRMWLNVRAKESRTNVSNQQCVIKRDSCGKVRCVYELSNLHVTREPRHQGLPGGRSLALRTDELSDTNSTNTSEDDVRGCLCSDRHVFNKRSRSLPREIVRSCQLLHDPLRISL